MWLLVGTARFELATPCTPSKCATRLRYVPTESAVWFAFEDNGEDDSVGVRLTNSTLANYASERAGCGKVGSRAAVPQRLEAAIDSAAVTARVELVPFPKPRSLPQARAFPKTRAHRSFCASCKTSKPRSETVVGEAASVMSQVRSQGLCHTLLSQTLSDDGHAA